MDAIDLIANNIVEIIEKDNDFVVAICGYEGTGKSSLTFKLAEKTGMLAKTGFSFEKNIIFNPASDDVVEKLMALPKRSSIQIDETYKAMNKLEFMTKKQRKLNQFFTVCRTMNHAIFMCMPRFFDFTEYQRKHRIKLWVQILRRGHAVAFRRDDNVFSPDPWNIKENYKLVNKLSSAGFSKLPLSKQKDIYSKCIGFVGFIRWGPMDKRKYAKYKKLSDEAKFQLEKDADDSTGMYKVLRNRFAKIITYIYNETDLTIADISKIVGCGPTTIQDTLKITNSRKIDVAVNKIKD